MATCQRPYCFRFPDFQRIT